MKIVCMKCDQFFHPKKNGVLVEEGRPATSADKRGEGNWLPYKLWMADSLECWGCGAVIVAGFGLHPISEHYQPDYDAQRQAGGPVVSFVRDCP